MQFLIVWLKLICLGLLVILFAIPQTIVILFCKGAAVSYLPQLWLIIGCRLFKLKTEISGAPQKGHVVFIGNHLSNFDIPVLGSKIPACFVAKRELASSLFVGILTRINPTAFVSRNPRQAQSDQHSVKSFLEKRRNLVLFAEGTTSRGDTVLPFKSSLLATLLDFKSSQLWIQPFTLQLVEVDGQKPDTNDIKDIYTWSPENTLELGPHTRKYLKTKGATVRITFHPAMPASRFTDRKVMAEELHKIVSAPLELAA